MNLLENLKLIEKETFFEKRKHRSKTNWRESIDFKIHKRASFLRFLVEEMLDREVEDGD